MTCSILISSKSLQTFLELLAGIAAVIAFSRPNVGAPFFRQIEARFAPLARGPRGSLAADTFAHARLANPASPSWLGVARHSAQSLGAVWSADRRHVVRHLRFLHEQLLQGSDGGVGGAPVFGSLTRRKHPAAVFLPIFLIGAAALAAYNYRITGNPMEPPYLLYRRIYGTPQSYWWQPAVRVDHFNNIQIRQNYEDQLRQWALRTSPGGLWKATWHRIRDFWRFLSARFLTPPLFFIAASRAVKSPASGSGSQPCSSSNTPLTTPGIHNKAPRKRS